jgi:hypothetical protein
MEESQAKSFWGNRPLTSRKGMGRIVMKGTSIMFSSTSPDVALVTLYTNCTISASPLGSNPTLRMKLSVVMAACAWASIVAINGAETHNTHEDVCRALEERVSEQGVVTDQWAFATARGFLATSTYRQSSTENLLSSIQLTEPAEHPEKASKTGNRCLGAI